MKALALIPTIEELESILERKLKIGELIRGTKALRFCAAVIFLAFIVTIAGLIWIPWIQTVHGKGKVIAYSPRERPQGIAAPVEGRINKWFVNEGEKVDEDQPLVELSDIDPLILEKLESERGAVARRITASQDALTTSAKNLERQRNLSKRGLSSQRAFELALLEFSKLETELAAAESELARLLVRIARQSSQTVKASRSGVISRINSPQGGVIVKAGQELATLVPDTTDRAVELIVSGNDVALLAAGRQVRLQFEGWPALQFSGWPSVAVGTFPGTVKLIDPADDGSGNFRVVIFPEENSTWPTNIYLRLGVRAIGWILLDEVSLGWELWRKFNGFPPTTSDPAEKEAYENRR